MPRGNWGIFAAALAGLTAFADPEPERYPSYQSSSGDQGEGSGRPAQQRLENSEAKPLCHNPKGAVESDLCAQWRAANAAAESAVWAERQFWASFFGIFGLGMTLYFSARATFAAVERCICYVTPRPVPLPLLISDESGDGRCYSVTMTSSDFS